MKAVFTFILLFPLMFFGQNKNDLLSTIEKKDQKIESLNEEIKKLKKVNKDLDVLHLRQLEERTSILKEINVIWLSEPFKNKYTSDYFLNTQFSKLDDGGKERMDNAQVMAKSFLLSENPKSDLYKLAEKVYDFNSNYYLLDSIITKIFEKKYDKNLVDVAVTTLREAPEIDNRTKLGIYKSNLINLLENYHLENCKLSVDLNNYYQVFLAEKGNPYVKSELKKKFSFNEEYPVLVQTRDNFIEDYNYYGKEENRLPDSCPKKENSEKARKIDGDVKSDNSNSEKIKEEVSDSKNTELKNDSDSNTEPEIKEETKN